MRSRNPLIVQRWRRVIRRVGCLPNVPQVSRGRSVDRWCKGGAVSSENCGPPKDWRAAPPQTAR